jgi:hypothetical protein
VVYLFQSNKFKKATAADTEHTLKLIPPAAAGAAATAAATGAGSHLQVLKLNPFEHVVSIFPPQGSEQAHAAKS